MMRRFTFALGGAVKHLLASILVAALVAMVIFNLWYPYPYHEISGGAGLFLLLVVVDVICGPLLTFVLLDPSKSVGVLGRDIGLVVVIQLLALGYGVYSMAEARPVFLAYEGDRFRVVSKADIAWEDQDMAEIKLSSLSFTGPVLQGTRLLKPTDPEFPASVLLAMEGVHPAYRSGRWVSYESQAEQVVNNAGQLRLLRETYPERADELDELLQRIDVNENNVGFLPLLSYSHSDWVILVDMTNALPLGFFPVAE